MVVSTLVSSQTVSNNAGYASHPRMLIGQEQLMALKASMMENRCWSALNDLLLDEANGLVSQPLTPIHFKGKTMLPQAREIFRKISYLSYAYQLTKEEAFAHRGIEELMHAAQLDTWNPDVFLDVAELTMAVAIGYDWLYPVMSERERRLIKEAIVQKGLKPSYDEKYNRFLQLDNNWNQVCNAAMVWGALAIYDEEPILAEKTIARAVSSAMKPIKKYGDHGGFAEGPMYWTYGTTYHVLMLEALAGAYWNTRIPLYSEGFLRSGQFFLNMIANSGRAFNWSDALEKHCLNPAIFWLANKTGDSSLLWNEKKILENRDYHGLVTSRFLPMVLLFGAGRSPEDISAPSSRLWTGSGDNEVVTMRTSWEDPSGIFLGFKLGNAQEHHAHMDMGAFVMEAEGVRWAKDLGMQDYHSLSSKKVNLWDSSQDGGRWTVFRYNNHGHNTLTLDDSLMDVRGQAKLLRSSDSEGFQYAIGDLTDVFLRKDRKILRGVAIRHQNQVVIRDEISASPEAVKIRWKMVTPGKVITRGNEAILMKNGKELRLQVHAPKEAQLKVWPANNHHRYDAANEGARVVGFELQVKKNCSEVIEVRLLTGGGQIDQAPSLPLSEWD
ncbi:heparinase [Echinicola strongylocentroti]|uniref:Heparinase n=2 Tax=Echinicola strongylocentroti TaxID=1795355 RepID=A0A2Z4IF30_9BACT|nr:heparinase [Echinicola strongylocentroti]